MGIQIMRNAGKSRMKIAEMLATQLGCIINPENIWQNNYPAARWMDLARWGCFGTDKDGRKVNVHSWETMGEIIKCKKIVRVGSEGDRFEFQVCRGD